MSDQVITDLGGETLEKAAAQWVVRLRSADCGEADWQAFEAWLQAAPDSRQAFDEAMSLWLSLDAAASAMGRPLTAASAAGRSSAGPQTLWIGGALAAALAVVALVAPILRTASTPVTVYATAKGERRSVRLADGTRIDLGGGSRLTVRMTPKLREVAMGDGEAAFQVVHNPDRPFVVTAGDRRIEDVGTEFDVRSRKDQLAVTVREGRVEVAPTASDQGGRVALIPGERLRHAVGAPTTVVDKVAADEAFAWRQGRLIYRDQPLQAVIDDLNQYFPMEVRIDGARAAGLRFTGVLTVDGEGATLRRLSMLLPVTSVRQGDAIVLKSRDNGR